MGGQSSKSEKETPSQAPKKQEEQLIFGDRNASRKIQYGHQGAPVSMFCGEMPPKLMEELHKLDIFSCVEEELENKGFFSCVDYPHIPTHTYYEGYFHSCRSPKSIESINPRRGATMDKPSAPPLLRAMYIAFREKNEEWFRGIAKELKELAEKDEDEEFREAVGVFAGAFDPENVVSENMLGDLAIQVHFGHEIGGGNIGFHTDALNSLFHFAFAVRGNRSLHSYRANTKEEAKTPTFDHYVDPQKEGDVYISSPALFRHGVEYPERKWEERIVAIQARTLFSREELSKVFYLKMRGKEAVGNIIANALLAGPTLPSYEEILAVCEKLEDF